MRTIKSILLLAAMVVSSMVIAQQAQGEDKGMGHDGMHGMHEKHEMLPNLTDAQKDQMKAIRLEAKKQMLPLKNQMGEKKAKMKTLTTSENVDLAQVDALIDEMTTLQAEMMKIKARQNQKIRSQLTEEQRLAFDTRKGKHKGMHGGKHKGHGPKDGRCEGKY